MKLVERFRTAINSCWAKYMAFRIAFVATFLISMMIISIYALSVFRPFSSWLVPVFLAVYIASGKHQIEAQAGFRRRYWWLPLILIAFAMAVNSYCSYTLNQIGYLVFSAALCIISTGFLVYYATWKRR